MKTIEQLEADLMSRNLITDHNPMLCVIIEELIALAKHYRDNAKHDRNAIRAMRGQTTPIKQPTKGDLMKTSILIAIMMIIAGCGEASSTQAPTTTTTASATISMPVLTNISTSRAAAPIGTQTPPITPQQTKPKVTTGVGGFVPSTGTSGTF